MLDAIVFVLVSGCQWRMVPADLVPWDVAYRWFRAWTADGTWDRVYRVLRDRARQVPGRDPAPTGAVLDAQSIKSSHGGQAIGYDAGKKVTGRKRHLVTDTDGLPLSWAVTAASVQDSPGGRELLGTLAAEHPSVAVCWADGGYNPTVLTHGARLGIDVRVVSKPPGQRGFTVLPRRWVIERTFAWLVTHRRLARDYERLTTHSHAMITLAMIRLLARRLTNEQHHWNNRPP